MPNTASYYISAGYLIVYHRERQNISIDNFLKGLNKVTYYKMRSGQYVDSDDYAFLAEKLGFETTIASVYTQLSHTNLTMLENAFYNDDKKLMKKLLTGDCTQKHKNDIVQHAYNQIYKAVYNVHFCNDPINLETYHFIFDVYKYLDSRIIPMVQTILIRTAMTYYLHKEMLEELKNEFRFDMRQDASSVVDYLYYLLALQKYEEGYRYGKAHEEHILKTECTRMIGVYYSIMNQCLKRLKKIDNTEFSDKLITYVENHNLSIEGQAHLGYQNAFDLYSTYRFQEAYDVLVKMSYGVKIHKIKLLQNLCECRLHLPITHFQYKKDEMPPIMDIIFTYIYKFEREHTKENALDKMKYIDTHITPVIAKTEAIYIAFFMSELIELCTVAQKYKFLYTYMYSVRQCALVR